MGELLIRSQDKENVVICGSPSSFSIIGNESIGTFEIFCESFTFTSLGVYSTHKQALEVLDELEQLAYETAYYQTVRDYDMPKDEGEN